MRRLCVFGATAATAMLVVVLLGGTAFAQLGPEIPTLPVPSPTAAAGALGGVAGTLGNLSGFGAGGTDSGNPSTLLDNTPLSNLPQSPVPSGVPSLDPLPSPTPSLPTLDEIVPPSLKSTLPDGLLPTTLLPGGGSPGGNPGGSGLPALGGSGSRPASTRMTVGTVFTDPKSATETATSSERYAARDAGRGSIGARAAELAAPMALPLVAALLGVFGFTMLARGRGSSGVEDDREALGGWSVIHL